MAEDSTMSEARETIVIVNAKGLHARASAKFVNMVAMLPDSLDIKVIKDGMEAGGLCIGPIDDVGRGSVQ